MSRATRIPFGRARSSTAPGTAGSLVGLHRLLGLLRVPFRVPVAGLVALAILASVTPAAAIGETADDPTPIDPDTLGGSVVDPEPELRPAGAPALAVTFSGTATSANARWIVFLFDETLGRSADAGGLDYWLARIAAGGEENRQAVARRFVTSVEGAGNEAERAYRLILGRSSDVVGRAYWTDLLQREPLNRVRFEFFASQEYYDRSGGTPAAFVTGLYRDVLERSPDRAGLAYWEAFLAEGGFRWQVVQFFYGSPESLGNRVDANYLELLGRGPTAAERTAGMVLVDSFDERLLRADLIGSDELFEPFLLDPDHTDATP